MHTPSIEILYDQQIMVHVKPSEAADLFASRNTEVFRHFWTFQIQISAVMRRRYTGDQSTIEKEAGLAQKSNNLNEKKSQKLL